MWASGQHAFFDEKAVATTAKLVSLFSAVRLSSSHEKKEACQTRIGVWTPIALNNTPSAPLEAAMNLMKGARVCRILIHALWAWMSTSPI